MDKSELDAELIKLLKQAEIVILDDVLTVRFKEPAHKLFNLLCKAMKSGENGQG